MIGIDGSMAENGSDWFCYHATSPCIFPVGFCEINNLDLTPPRGKLASGYPPTMENRQLFTPAVKKEGIYNLVKYRVKKSGNF